MFGIHAMHLTIILFYFLFANSFCGCCHSAHGHLSYIYYYSRWFRWFDSAIFPSDISGSLFVWLFCLDFVIVFTCVLAFFFLSTPLKSLSNHASRMLISTTSTNITLIQFENNKNSCQSLIIACPLYWILTDSLSNTHHDVFKLQFLIFVNLEFLHNLHFYNLNHFSRSKILCYHLFPDYQKIKRISNKNEDFYHN